MKDKNKKQKTKFKNTADFKATTTSSLKNGVFKKRKKGMGLF